MNDIATKTRADIPVDPMRPDRINWSTKRHHVALHFLPQGQLHHRVAQWHVIAVALQCAMTAALCFLFFVSPAGHESDVSGLASGWVRSFVGYLIPIVLAGVVTTLIVLPLIYGRFRQRTASMHRLHTAIRALASGADPQPLPVGTHNEVDYLLASFNDMAARLLAGRRELLDANQNLEQRVNERTSQLARATELAQEASKAKSRFLATMSHEIRTPLNGVLGALALLEASSGTPKQRRMVRTGRLAGKALLNQINDILDMSAIEAGQLKLATQAFCLREVIEEAVTIIAPSANHKRLDVVHHLDPSLPETWTGDPVRIRQIVINLLNNAIKFTDSGHVEIGVANEPSGQGLIRFEVRDTGIGMMEEAAGMLFREFVQAGNDHSGARGGTGLGLSICKQLVELMGGQIGVQSKVGEGSLFWFTIRLAPDETSVAQRTTSPKHVLLIEASEPVRRMMQNVLEVHGHRLECATESNLDEALKTRLDLIVVGQGTTPCTIGETFARLNPLLKDNSRIATLRAPEDSADIRANTELPIAHVLHRPLLGSELLKTLGDGLADSGVKQSQEIVALSAIDVPKQFRVLVVDDQPINQFVIRNMLEMIGVEADLVNSGESAIDAMRSRSYAIVFMDYLMPGLDGIETTRRIRALETTGEFTRRAPIVALSATVSESDREQFRQAGMDDCLGKPLDPIHLREVIARFANQPHASTTASPAIKCSTTNPPAADEFRFENLLSLCNNNQERFRTFLKMTDEHYRQFKAELASISPTTDASQVRKLGHTIAGCAGQADFRTLATAAKAMERADASARMEAVSRVLCLINSCLTSLETYRASLEPATDVSVQLTSEGGEMDRPNQIGVDSKRLISRVLLVEDEPAWREILSSHFLQSEIDLVVARDGVQALSIALNARQAGQAFDLVVMDIQLPGWDGYETTRKIRQAGIDVPIIAFSASNEQDFRSKCLAAGCSDCAPKTVDKDELLRIIRTHLSSSVRGVTPAVLNGMTSSLVKPIDVDSAALPFLERFISELPSRIHDLRDLLERQQLTDLRGVLHRLRGTGGVFGFIKISELAGRAEDLIVAEAKLDQVERAVLELVSVIRSVHSSPPVEQIVVNLAAN